MPTEYDEDGNEIEEEETGDQSPKSLREAAKRSKANEAAAVAAQRELAFVKAGVDTDSKVGKLVLATYDGELTKEAITEYISDIPGLAPQNEEQEQEDEEEDPDRRSTGERNDLANDSAGDEGGKPDPRREAVKVAKQAIEDGAPEDEAGAQAFQVLVGAGMDGDRRVIL